MHKQKEMKEEAEKEKYSKENLGLKIGTKEEVEWTKIKNSQEDTIRASKINIAIAEIILKLAEGMIKIEEEKKKLPIGIG